MSSSSQFGKGDTSSSKLIFSSYDELKKASETKDNNLDFKQTNIASILLKIYDQGNLYLSGGEDEKAYILFMRFVENGLKFSRSPKSKLSTNKSPDDIYKKVEIAISHLEKVQSRLKECYEELERKRQAEATSASAASAQSKSLAAAAATAAVKTNTLSGSFDPSGKKSLSCKELSDLLKQASANCRVLIIDTRTRLEFDTSKMNLTIFTSRCEEANVISYINVSSELIETVCWKTLEALRRTSSDEVTANVFASRHQYDFIVLLDATSSWRQMASDLKIMVLKRAMFEFDMDATKLKNEPLILDGGWREWLLYFAVYTTTKGDVNSANKNAFVQQPQQQQTSKKSTLDQIDYPPFPSTTVAPKPTDTNKSNINNKTPAPANETSGEPTTSTAAPAATIANMRVAPSINRSSKPRVDLFDTASPSGEEVDLIEIELIDNSVGKAATPDASNLPGLRHQRTSSYGNSPLNNIINSSSSSNNNINGAYRSRDPSRDKLASGLSNGSGGSGGSGSGGMPVHLPPIQRPPASSPSPLPLPSSNPPNGLNVNDRIFSAVYAPPSRLLKQMKTPMGTSKVLNSETGLFAATGPFYQPPPPPQQSTAAKPPPAPHHMITPSTLAHNYDDPRAVLALMGGRNAANSVKPPPPPPSSSTASGGKSLKRTYSSPNIADSDQLLVKEVNNDNENDNDDDEDDHSENENARRQQQQQPPAQQSMAKSKSDTRRAPLQPIRPSIDPGVGVEKEMTDLRVSAQRPSVNRASKPPLLADTNAMRSRMDELEPQFGNVNPGLTGIRNLGNTCFMNSVLQCLSSTDKLTRYFLNDEYKRDINRHNELGFKGQIADEFAILVKAMWTGHCRSIAPKRFKHLIGQLNEQFLSYEQQDAQEFLLFLLDGLHEDLNRVTKRPRQIKEKDENLEIADDEAAHAAWQAHLTINNSIVVDLFQGQFKSTVTCLTCNKQSIKFDAFMYLTLPLLGQRCTIEQCLELFLKPENMSGESQWKCPRCKELRDATKKIDIWKLPQLLIIHLKRFKYHGMWRDKINVNVDYPVDKPLYLDKYVMRPATDASASAGYRLYATSNHTGTMDGGHYTAMCRHVKTGCWFRFDDTNVRKLDEPSSALKMPSSYILFYARA